jgi:hypothetical protein
MIYALSLGGIALIAAIVWYFFMVPLGKERHERELELIRRKLEKLEAQRRAGIDVDNERSGS